MGKARNAGIITAVALTVAAFAFGPGTWSAAAESQGNLPSFIVMAVNPGGALLNTLGNGLAKVISERAPFQVKLRTSSGYLDTMSNDGSVQLSMSVSVETHQSSHGLEQYKGRRQDKIRLVVGGPSLVLGFLVRKEAPYQSVADLKGARVTGKYPGTKPAYWDGYAMFAGADMSWNDVKVVPVGDLGEGVRALIEGRADAAVCAARTGLVQQANASTKGVRFLPLPEGKEAAAKMWKAVPGFYPVVLKAGSALGVDRDMSLGAKDVYLISGTKTDPAVVYEVTKILWNHMDAAYSIHPSFRQWTHEKMLKTDVTIPYHEGAIRFYKEIGKWTPELEKRQEALLAALR